MASGSKLGSSIFMAELENLHESLDVFVQLPKLRALLQSSPLARIGSLDISDKLVDSIAENAALDQRDI